MNQKEDGASSAQKREKKVEPSSQWKAPGP